MKRVGEDEVRPLIPEEDLPLLTAIAKAERKKQSARVVVCRDDDA